MSELVLRCAACGRVIAVDDKRERLDEYRIMHHRMTQHRAVIMTAYMAGEIERIAPLIPTEEQPEHAPA